MLLAFLQKNLANVALRMEEAFYNISMYLHNKNDLEYAKIARSGPKSMIRDIEGLSSKYPLIPFPGPHGLWMTSNCMF